MQQTSEMKIRKTLDANNPERAREEALARLVALLERGNPHPHVPQERGKPNPLSQLARLQAAHATYVLANTGEMERTNTGAYFRHSEETRRQECRPEQTGCRCTG